MQLAVFILAYPLLWLISRLPFTLIYLLSDGIYGLLYYVIGYRKKVVRENLALVFPEKTEKERLQIEKKFYRHMCDMFMEMIKTMGISKKEIQKRFTVTNMELLNNLEEKGINTMLMLPHYASWEWIFIIQKYIKHRGYGIYKRLRNKYFDRLVKKIRARYNTYLITTKETIETLTNLKQNGILFTAGFASDQSPKVNKAYHWQSFFDIMVPWHTGAEMIAKKLDIPVVFFKVKKVKRGFYETTFQTVTLNPREFKDYEITDMFAKYVEEQIKEAPEYYLWTHKRWKHKDKVPSELQSTY